MNLKIWSIQVIILIVVSHEINNKKYATVITIVLIHLDQHFIERGPCRSERGRTLEISTPNN
jgi:hypothetical protein